MMMAGNELDYEQSLADVISLGPDVYQLVFDEFLALEGIADAVGGLEPFEAKWRLTYLLGTLDPTPGVVESLEAIASFDLPDPSSDPEAHEAEFRVRLCAINGLRKLGAVEALLNIFDGDGVFSLYAAIVLAELGTDVLSLPVDPALEALEQEEIDESTDPRPNSRESDLANLGGRPGFGSEGEFDPGDAPPVSESGSLATRSANAKAASCSLFIDTVEDRTSNWCWQGWVDYYWNAYAFSKSNVLNEGWHDPCNVNLPLGRFFNAIDLVNYAAPDFAVNLDDFGGSFLRWAGNYTIREIDELKRGCFGSSSTIRATTDWGPIIDEKTTFWHPAFEENVIERASTLVHEARHASWCGHNGGGCVAGASCDDSWLDGCSFPGSGRGANGYQVLWLWWYAVGAQPALTNARMRAFAIDHANTKLDRSFDDDPCFRLDSNGNRVSTC